MEEKSNKIINPFDFELTEDDIPCGETSEELQKRLDSLPIVEPPNGKYYPKSMVKALDSFFVDSSYFQFNDIPAFCEKYNIPKGELMEMLESACFFRMFPAGCKELFEKDFLEYYDWFYHNNI